MRYADDHSPAGLPPSGRQRITKTGALDLAALHQRLIKTRFAPQELVAVTQDRNSYWVWLEQFSRLVHRHDGAAQTVGPPKMTS